jgi:hypothetical protein
VIALQKLPISAAAQAAINRNIQQYAQFIIGGEKASDALKGAYKTDEIKDRLKEETRNKCAYCESCMLHVDYGDIEHIKPKGRNPVLRFEYWNLTLSCGVCNTKKAEFEDIIDPYSANPADHLVPHGPLIFRHAASDAGLMTEKRLDLNRAPLLERRKERLQALAVMADQIARTTNGVIRQVLVDEFKAEASNDKEFSLVARAFVDQICAQIGV